MRTVYTEMREYKRHLITKILIHRLSKQKPYVLFKIFNFQQLQFVFCNFKNEYISLK